MATIDWHGNWHSRKTGKFINKPWVLGGRLSHLFGSEKPAPKVKALIDYSNGLEKEMTPDKSEDQIVALGDKLQVLLDDALPEINKSKVSGADGMDQTLEDFETTAFFLTTPRIWPVAPEEEKPKASSAGYRKVGSERRSSTRGVERVKNYTEEEKQALGINDLPQDQRAEFRRLRKDYLSDGIRQSAVRASVFLEEVGDLIKAVGPDTPLGKELAKWQMVMRRRVGVHEAEEYAAKTEKLKADAANFKSDPNSFASVLKGLGDTSGAAAVQKYAAVGDSANLNKLLDMKIKTLENAISAMETFVSSYPADGKAEIKSGSSSKGTSKGASKGASGTATAAKTPRAADTRSASAKSASATKGAATRAAGGGEQWRAPEGTPQGGQFIDMPGAAAAKVGSTATGQQIKALLDGGKVPEAQRLAEKQLKLMDQALNSFYSMGFAAKVVAMTASGGTVTKTKWEGPIGFEGKFTGDNRYIMPMGLDFANVTFPQPFRWASEDIGAHDGARVIGTIAGIKRLADGTIWGWGTFDMKSELGMDAQRHVEEELTAGVSMDLDKISAEVADHAQMSAEIANLADSVEDMNITVIRKARTRSATLVALPAFEGARIKCVDQWSHTAKNEKLQMAMTKYGAENRKRQILRTWEAKFGSVPTKAQVKEEKVKELAMALRLKSTQAPNRLTVRIPKKV